MALKTIYVARHGYRSNWLPEGPYPAPPTGIDSDVPLAEHGVDQAKQLAEYISATWDEERKPQMVFTSPFYRCVQTSEPVVKALELPLVIERGLGEWYKPDRPVIPEPATVAQLSELFPEVTFDTQWGGPTVIPSRKGETEQEIFARSGDFLSKFLDRMQRDYPDIERVLFVTHAATKQCIGMKLLNIENVRDSIDEQGNVLHNASCSIDWFEYTGNNWLLKMNGETSFLKDGAEMDWNFTYGFEAGSDADIKARRLRGEIN